MDSEYSKYQIYYEHLRTISRLGLIYKRGVVAPLLYLAARKDGKRLLEVGSGIGSGVLGAFPGSVTGLDINPLAVDHCRRMGLRAHTVKPNGGFPFEDGEFDGCIMDNVLEHIPDPSLTLDECHRVTRPGGTLVIAVPGFKGFDADPDHKVFYREESLKSLDPRYFCTNLLASPFFVPSSYLSKTIRQYCLIAVYQRKT